MNKKSNKKILETANKVKRSIAFMSTSVLVTPLITPLQEVAAAEKTSVNHVQGEKHSQNPFLNAIITPASSIAAKNDLYASVMLAQAILESAWGQSSLGAAPNYNLFGIKGDYNGESVKKNTLEDNGKQEYYQIEANFRKYPSYKESLEDYAQLIKNGTSWDPAFYSGAWKSNAETYQDATEFLTGRYATDTAYATKLNRIIETHNLDTYDVPATVPEVPTVSSNAYIVKGGDTLYGIARKHQISLDDLMNWNQLKNTIIHPGMSLKVVQEKQAERPVVTAPEGNKTEKLPTIVATYHVQSGDTLWSISSKNKVTVAQLKEWNQLKNDVIQPGQVLKLTQQQSEVPKAETQEKVQPAAPNELTKSITVKSGDTLYRIAQKAGISVSTLKALNNLTNEIIQPGQVLSVQEKVSQTKPVAEKTTPVAVSAYTVQKGDTLYRIAQQAGISVATLKTLNNLKNEIIQPGQVLSVQEKVSQTKPVAEKTTPAAVSTYTVQKGDTLYRIANKHGVSVTSLMEWNNVNSTLIYPGQTLKVK